MDETWPEQRVRLKEMAEQANFSRLSGNDRAAIQVALDHLNYFEAFHAALYNGAGEEVPDLSSKIAALVGPSDDSPSHEALIAALQPIAAAYPDDPGTSDLDNEQPVTITLGDVRKVWRALGKAGVR